MVRNIIVVILPPVKILIIKKSGLKKNNGIIFSNFKFNFGLVRFKKV